MIVEVINVGTELLLGEIVNTNANAIFKMCKELGFDVYHQSVVGDNPKRFLSSLDSAFQRGANLVITTGGIGPTQDDITKSLCAQYLGLEMEFLEEEKNKIENKIMFLDNASTIANSNYTQAYFPEGCTILENDIGTANGCLMQANEQMIVNLPGPPKELRYMLEHALIPILKKYAKSTLYTQDVYTMNIGESRLADVLQDVIAAQSEVSIALYAAESNVRIRFACKAHGQQQADEKMYLLIQQVKSVLQGHILEVNDVAQILFHCIPKHTLIFDGDFQIEDFHLGSNECKDTSFEVRIAREKECLGDRIRVVIHAKIKEEYEIRVLNRAELSIEKISYKIRLLVLSYIKKYEMESTNGEM